MSDQPPDRPLDRSPVPLTVVSDQLGLTVEAIRSRCRRGTLSCQRLPGGGWVVMPTDQVTGERPVNHLPDQPVPGHGRAPTGSVPDALVALVDRQAQQIAELSAAAALWQERARFLGERLAALEAGPGQSQESTASENAPRTHTVAPQRDETGRVGSSPSCAGVAALVAMGDGCLGGPPRTVPGHHWGGWPRSGGVQ